MENMTEKTIEAQSKIKTSPDRVLNFACELGIRLIRNGAEIYRVEESIERVIKAYDYEKVEVFAIPSFIIINIEVDTKNYTKSIRVRMSSNNLDRLNKMNDLCRKICAEKPDIDTAEKFLREIIAKPGYSTIVSCIGYGFAAFFFTLFFGGGFFDSLIAFLCGIIVKFSVSYMKNRKSNIFFQNLVAAFLLAIIPVILNQFLIGVHLDKIIIGAIMLLVPGIAIINVMRDMLSGDLLTAIMKFSEVMIVAIAIAIGIAIPIAGMRIITAFIYAF